MILSVLSSSEPPTTKTKMSTKFSQIKCARCELKQQRQPHHEPKWLCRTHDEFLCDNHLYSNCQREHMVIRY